MKCAIDYRFAYEVDVLEGGVVSFNAHAQTSHVIPEGLEGPTCSYAG